MSHDPLIPPEQNEQQTGWIVVSAEGQSSHVMPSSDLRDHEYSMDCWCRPRVDDGDGDTVVHNAMDRRELIETGKAWLQ